MGIGICTDCKGAVSEQADACVHCGNPLMQRSVDAVGMVVGLLYTAYVIVTVGFIALAALRAFVYWSEGRIPPSSEDLMVFFLWLISVCAGGLLASALRRGPKTRVKGAIRTAGSAEIERFFARRDQSAP